MNKKLFFGVIVGIITWLYFKEEGYQPFSYMTVSISFGGIGYIIADLIDSSIQQLRSIRKRRKIVHVVFEKLNDFFFGNEEEMYDELNVKEEYAFLFDDKDFE